jgi:hypothetical protein
VSIIHIFKIIVRRDGRIWNGQLGEMEGKGMLK